jgi:deoxyribodipyrimidine photo-lyase
MVFLVLVHFLNIFCKNQDFKMTSFPTDYDAIEVLMSVYNPNSYSRTRNFLDGNVSRLSPYISRGVISTRRVYESLISRGYRLEHIEKFVQELAWRDYWQTQWNHFGGLINKDLRVDQRSYDKIGKIPKKIKDIDLSIDVINRSLSELYSSGYIHNHMRMYIAMTICNVGSYHWHTPAKWMYYHLLDGDWASNALSWQWVAGCLNGRKYFANQDNINKYCRVSQKNTFLDKSYENLMMQGKVEELENPIDAELTWNKPSLVNPKNLPHTDTLIYNFYNLDPTWRKEQKANRVLLIEPDVFNLYPVSERVMDFFFKLSKNIPDIIYFVGHFDELEKFTSGNIYYRQHPLNNYRGIEDKRESLSNVEGNFSSFFKFWKLCKKSLVNERDQRRLA